MSVLDSRLMRKRPDNLISQYVLILCLGVALLFGQMSRLHMHVQHDGDHATAVAGHIVEIHNVLSLHEIDTTHAGEQHDQHQVTSDISQNYLVKKASQMTHLALIGLFIGLFLYMPRLFRLNSLWRYVSPILNFRYYLLYPPLRAPPLS